MSDSHSRRAMRRVIRLSAVVALAAIVWVAALPARAMTIEPIRSPGGIEAWLVREPAVPLVTLNFAFPGGSSQDPQGKDGLANLVASLLDEGAGQYDSTAFHGRLEENAVEFRFSATRDDFRGTMRVLKEHRDEAFELMRLMLNEPRFDPSAVERMRAQTLAVLARYQEQPERVAARAWWAAAFPGHPYGRPARGTVETVGKVTIDDLKDYRRRVFAREGLKVAIVGDIDAAAAGTMLDKIFGGLAAKGELTPVPDVKPLGLGSRVLRDLNVPQATIVFGGAGISRGDPDFIAAYIVNYILGGGSFSSRLYNEVREKKGLAYGIHERLVWLRHGSVVLGSTATRSDRAAEALAITEREIDRMRESGPTADELEKAKSYLKGSYALSLDSSTKIAAQLVQIQLDDLGIDYIGKRSGLIDAVTLDDAKRVAKRLFEGGLLVSVAGRPRGLTANAPGG